MSSKSGRGGNKSTPFKVGGQVGDEQRQYFKDASKEIRNLGLKVVARRVKRSAAEDDLIKSGRKVKKTFLPFKKAIINNKIEKEKQENLITESILRGEKPIKKSIKSNSNNNKDDEPGLKIGRFSNGTLHINKHDIKTVYSSKSKGYNRGGSSSRGGGGGGRGGSRGGGRGGRSGGRGGKR
ncbi:hypothetical protein DDB_G0277563 [Dictyostelium discoideum AX4]|uniref:Uncharacterized protein n=1 Tax=Dictyostelium discoideum TaxID=44689 RepID=Q54ZI5_DICDI|nr:hypothetical protein DDB_G0277563 [Dictyostelium discoideum AX4]EAL68744.1 hypothetical protein DDB_G0277563 [Dictyostelium discoideum AX4]|eukprot:XP_642657.1 hypothetical protein DDB_G0277563 [Dictyostelium discoideum AX4]